MVKIVVFGSTVRDFPFFDFSSLCDSQHSITITTVDALINRACLNKYSTFVKMSLFPSTIQLAGSLFYSNTASFFVRILLLAIEIKLQNRTTSVFAKVARFRSYHRDLRVPSTYAMYSLIPTTKGVLRRGYSSNSR